MPKLPRKLWSQITVWRVLLAMMLSVALYNEVLCYWFATFSWHALPPPSPTGSSSSQHEEQLRILFIADPQLVGYHDAAIIRPVSRADCDRYLAKTYSYAVSHVQPDVLVFMGDLLDEGSTANNEDYQTYVDRFNAVFPSHGIKHRVVIPGDNDVGGEGFDRKTDQKVERFNRHFAGAEGKTSSTGLVQTEFVDFFTMSLDEYDHTPNIDAFKEIVRSTPKPGKYAILINHFEIVPRFDVSSLLKELRVNLLFTAHNHKAAIYTCLDCRGPELDDSVPKWRHQWKGQKAAMTDSKLYRFNLTRSTALEGRVTGSAAIVTEIAIPTCSYRMGVPQMGYGAAVLDASTGTMHYTVLWLPSRYTCLFAYIFMLIVCAMVLFLKCLYLVLCRKAQPYQRPAVLPLYARDD